MATLKTNYATGDVFTPGSTGGTTGINATNDRVNTHTHEGTNTPLLTQHPLIVGSDSGSTVITGNGSAQNVFTDSWIALTEGQSLDVEVWIFISAATAGSTPTGVLTLGSVTADSSAYAVDSNPSYGWFKISASYSATAHRGHLHSWRKLQSATYAFSTEVVTNTDTMSSITFTFNPSGGQNLTVQYKYCVTKYSTGI